MGFLDMGIGEILLILIVALIIWGPGKVPEIARTLGRIVRALRKASFDLTTTVTKELNMEKDDRPSQPRTDSNDKTKQSSDVGTTEHRDEEVPRPRD